MLEVELGSNLESELEQKWRYNALKVCYVKSIPKEKDFRVYRVKSENKSIREFGH